MNFVELYHPNIAPKNKPLLKLKALRVENRITQKEIAEELGISKSSYAKKENGIGDFWQYECYKLLKIFGEKCGEILF